jgi:propionyl-CoA carboxylase alpha chain
MRVVENETEFESQMNRAISEALNALEMVLFLSKISLSSSYRNQIMADSHGNILYLFERECSISAAIKR